MTAAARLPAPGRAPLGLYARSFDRARAVDPRDRRVRYRLQGIVQRLMHRYGAPRELQERVCTCHYSRMALTVKIRRNLDSGRCSYQGLETCSNVWICPICAGRITEQRRAELQAAIVQWVEQGGETYLMTLTFPHMRTDRLLNLLELMRQAIARFNTSKGVRTARAAAGYIGSIRALEVTWGAWHGWHPHFHVLLFCRPGQLEILRRMQSAWIAALIKTGLADRAQLDDLLHGAAGESPAFDLQNGDYAADYIAKYGHEPSLQSQIETSETWGAARELVKGMTKTGRRLSGITPFTLLAVIAEIRAVRGLSPGRATALFAEFALAFKGQRQLYWSTGLRRALGQGRLFADDELPALLDQKSECVDVCEISAADWRLIVTHMVRDEVLEEAERFGAEGARALLDRLRARPPTRSQNDAGHDALDKPRVPHVVEAVGVRVFGNPFQI